MKMLLIVMAALTSLSIFANEVDSGIEKRDRRYISISKDGEFASIIGKNSDTPNCSGCSYKAAKAKARGLAVKYGFSVDSCVEKTRWYEAKFSFCTTTSPVCYVELNCSKN